MEYLPRTYEEVFSSNNRPQSFKLNLDKISAGDMTLDEYISISKNSIRSFYSSIFDDSVKFAWLRRRFTLGKEKTNPQSKNNTTRLCGTFVQFMRKIVGMDPQLITRSSFFHYLEPYFEELFPGFVEGNPFTNPDYYKFPFKHVSIDFLPVVLQVDNRMELLKLAEEREMTYPVFADYVTNYIMVTNEKLGREKYIVRGNTRNKYYLFQIEDMDKKQKKWKN